MDSNFIGISLDNYLGEDCVFYKMLATPIPRYITRRMTEREIVRDALYGWLNAEYPFRPRRLDLLSGIIYQGKIMYLLENCCLITSRNGCLGILRNSWNGVGTVKKVFGNLW